MTRNTALATLVGAAGLIGVARTVRRRNALRGQVALVTGGSRGLGLLLARELGRAGCRVAICGRDGTALDRARDRLARDGLDVATFVCDVRDRGAVERLVVAIGERLGSLDILVNDAGEIEVAPFETMGHDDFARAMAVHFWGPLHTTLAALPHMRARRAGRIVNVTSIGGRIAMPHLLPYAAGKAAAIALSEGLRAELAGSGITVTTIVPGLMRTGSFLAARFGGNARAEARWFSVGASVPGMAMSAERAARKIVAALRRGDAVRTLGLPAQVAALAHGIAPGAVSRMLGVVARLLPAADGRPEPRPGAELTDALRTPGMAPLTHLGFVAAGRLQ